MTKKHIIKITLTEKDGVDETDRKMIPYAVERALEGGLAETSKGSFFTSKFTNIRVSLEGEGGRQPEKEPGRERKA